MASILTHRTPLAPGQKYFELPKTQMDQKESRPTRTFPNIQTTHPPCASANPNFYYPTPTSVEEYLVKPKSNMFKKSIQLGNSVAPPTDPHHSYRSLQGTLLPLSQIATPETKILPKTGVVHITEAVTVELG